MHLIIGLGNPGEKYKNTRHNIGFSILDKIVQELNLSWQENKKFNALICRDINSDIIFVKPLTFMNNSGQAVQKIMSYYKLLPKKISVDLTDILTVIHDDLDIDLGKTKISLNSRSAGHNGVQSIINFLNTQNFKRIRIGIRTDFNKNIPIEKFVLQNFNPEELKIINSLKNIL